MTQNKTQSETQFFITKMKCAGCVENATNAIKKVNGVEAVTIDLESEVGKVGGNIDPQAVCFALGEAGFPSVVKS